MNNRWPLMYTGLVVVAMLVSGCESDDSPYASSELTAATSPDDNGTGTKTKEEDATTVAFETLGTESEFVEAFWEEIRSEEDLIGLYSRHTLRPQPAHTPPWALVDFTSQMVIYVSLGACTQPRLVEVRSVEQTPSSLIVGMLYGHALWDECPVVTTNYPGHIILLPKSDLPVTYEQTGDVILLCP
jgi:hypothetical protein